MKRIFRSGFAFHYLASLSQQPELAWRNITLALLVVCDFWLSNPHLAGQDCPLYLESGCMLGGRICVKPRSQTSQSMMSFSNWPCREPAGPTGDHALVYGILTTPTPQWLALATENNSVCACVCMPSVLPQVSLACIPA